MLKMNKDHRSAGLRWSLLLSGGSLGGHDSSLSFICTCFVFPITACVAADVFVKYLSHLMVNEKNQLPYIIMIAWRPVFLHWKSTLWVPRAPCQKGRKRASHVWWFWLLILNCSGKSHGISASVCLSWVGWLVLGLKWWPNAMSFCFYHRRLLSFVCFEPSKQSVTQIST